MTRIDVDMTAAKAFARLVTSDDRSTLELTVGETCIRLSASKRNERLMAQAMWAISAAARNDGDAPAPSSHLDI